MFSGNLAYTKYERSIGEALEQEEKLCNEMETVRELAYFGDRVNAGGGCVAT